MRALIIFAVSAMIAMILPRCVVADTWINLGGVSAHPAPGFNGQNLGLGIEQSIDTQSFVSAGIYRNSVRRRSRYMVYGHRLVSDGIVSAGYLAGVVDGYRDFNHGGITPMGAAFVSVDGKIFGVNIVFVPPAGETPALALQFKARVW